MSDIKKPLLDEEHASVNGHADADKKPVPAPVVQVSAVHNQVVFARRIHNMITIQFLIVSLLVYLVSLSPEVQDVLKDIWIVFTFLILYIVIGTVIIVALTFSVKKTFLTVFVLVFLTFSLAFFISYLGASSSMNAGIALAGTMAIINLVYSVVCQVSEQRITTETGIISGIVASLFMTGGIFYANYNENELPITLCLIYLFITTLYSAYIFLNVKSMADGAREAIGEQDYMIAAVMVYLDFSIGLIIAIFREACAQIVS